MDLREWAFPEHLLCASTMEQTLWVNSADGNLRPAGENTVDSFGSSSFQPPLPSQPCSGQGAHCSLSSSR